VAQQTEAIWGPILKRYETAIREPLPTSDSFLVQEQPAALRAFLSYDMAKLDDISFAALEMVIHDLKSVLLGVALSRSWVCPEEAVRATTLELGVQTERWGLVEDVHELDLSRLLASCRQAAFVWEACRR
jgi:chaperone required for assembly of F1-ATPase